MTAVPRFLSHYTVFCVSHPREQIPHMRLRNLPISAPLWLTKLAKIVSRMNRLAQPVLGRVIAVEIQASRCQGAERYWHGYCDVFYILVRLLHSQRHALAQMSSTVRVARQFKTCSALVGSA